MLRRYAHGALRAQVDRECVWLAIDCLVAIGVQPEDLAVLRPLLGTDHSWRAASAIGRLGPGAADVVPDLADSIAHDSDWTAPTAEMLALKAIGPAAAPAVDALRLVLWSPPRAGHASLSSRLAEDERIPALDALGAIGPGGAPSVPDILELMEAEPHLHVPGSCAIIRIAPESDSAFELAESILLAPDVQAHARIAEALRTPGCEALRSILVAALIELLSSEDGCDRIAAVRGLVSLHALPRDTWDALSTDVDPIVRVMANKRKRESQVDTDVQTME